MKKILIYAIVILVLMQFYRPTRNNYPVNATQQIGAVVNVPENVQEILKRSCNDCHSNQTQYLWYHNIAPLSYGVAYHIYEGKKHLNFDEFNSYNDRKKNHTFEEIAEVVKSGEMPMKGYVLFHPKAALTQDDKNVLVNWSNSLYKK